MLAPVHVKAPVVELSAMGAEALTAGVPEALGHVIVGVPATACGVTVTVPEVAPTYFICPEVPAAPMESAGDTHVRLALPPNDPALLNCTCVVEPPGVPPPPLPVTQLVTPAPSVCK